MNLPTARSTSVGAGFGSSRHRLPLAIDDVVDLAHVQTVLDAVHVRKRRVDLDDHDPRPRRDCAVPEVGGAEVEVPIGVDRARLDDHHVRRVDEASVVVGDLAEVARDVVLQPGVALLAVVATEMPVENTKCSRPGSASTTASGRRLRHPRILTSRQLVHPCAQRSVERIGLGQPGAVVDPVTGLDKGGGGLGRDAPGGLGCAGTDQCHGHVSDGTKRLFGAGLDLVGSTRTTRSPASARGVRSHSCGLTR